MHQMSSDRQIIILSLSNNDVLLNIFLRISRKIKGSLYRQIFNSNAKPLGYFP